MSQEIHDALLALGQPRHAQPEQALLEPFDQPLQASQIIAIRRGLAAQGFHIAAQGYTITVTDPVTGRTFTTAGPEAYLSMCLAGLLATLDRLDHVNPCPPTLGI